VETSQVKVIYEDRWLMVVDKPQGMVTTRELNKGDKLSYLEDWVGQYYPNELYRKGVAHRLDKETSGLVVIAKDEETRLLIKDLFKKRMVVKKYLALVGGDLPMVGDMNMPIGRNKYFLGRFKVDVNGKPAVTEFRVLKKIKIDGKTCSLVEVNLKTGRTHQIRVHFSYLGWPLVGDKMYKGMEVAELKRQFLHSFYLKIIHPRSGEVLEVRSDLPDDLKNILKKYEV
jgi:23S rRNA pseudouridine1911/1915/1917 synthase